MDIGGAAAIDAVGCQKELVADIRERGGDYLPAAKDNQPILRRDIKEYFGGLETGEIRGLPEDVWTSGEETGRGRKGRRGVRTVRDIDWMAGKKDWPDLKTLIRYRCWRSADFTPFGRHH